MASNAMTFPRERRSGSIETKPGAVPGTDLHGRPAGAHGAAPSTPARPASRPEPRSGRPRARVFRLLPVLALLLGALGLFAAAPVEAAHQFATPTNLQAQAGDGQVTLTWSGGPRDNFDLQHGEHPSGTLSVQTVSANGNGSYTVTITSLTNDTTYRFRVRTRASSGHTASAWTSFVTATPSAPSSTPIWSATLAVKQVAGTSRGCDNSRTGAKCSSTSVLTDDDFTLSGTTWEISFITGTSSRLQVGFNSDVRTALDSYSFCVGTTALAFSSAGHVAGNTIASWRTSAVSWGVGDTPSLSIGTSCAQQTTPTTPAAPTNLASLAGDGSLYFEWTAPSGTLTGYDVHYTSAPTSGNGAVTNDAAVQTASAAAGWLAVSRSGTDDYQEITGLTNGRLYRVRVRAINASGAGAWAFGTGTPEALVPPSNLVVTPGDAELRVSWTAATGTFAGYDLDITSAAVGDVANDAATGSNLATAWVLAANPISSATSYTIDSDDATLVNGVTYRVRLRTASPESAYTYGTGTPQAQVSTVPTGLTVTAGDAQLTARWTAPAGVDVARYEVQIKLKSAANWPNADTDVSSGTSHTFTGLTNDSTYQVRVRTVETGGDDISAWTTPAEGTPRAAVQPKATTAVLGNMTVGDGGKWKGFRADPSVGALSDADFTYGGVDYRILGLRLTNSGGYLYLHLNKALARNWGLVLNVGDSRFRIADAALFRGNYEGVLAGWGYSNQGETAPTWTVGQSVPVSLGTLTSSTVKLSVSPNPVAEGASATVEACLSALPQGTVRIPVTLSHGDSANRSEDGDWGVSLSGDTDGRLPVHTAYSIAISGWLQRACGVVNIPTHPDSDSDDETFRVALDTTRLPPGVRAGSPALVVVTIQEPRNWPKVTLRAAHGAVAEGSPVELQVTLEKPLATDVEIPLRVRFVRSESGDHGFLRSITIAAGSTTGSGTIRTYEDDDTEDEYFQVGVIQPDLPSGVAPGSPSTVGIVIVDAANARLRALDLNAGN